VSQNRALVHRLLPFVLAVGACFSEPDYEGRFCNAVSACPMGLTCTEGRCQRLSSIQDASFDEMDASAVGRDATEIYIADAGTTPRDATPRDALPRDADAMDADAMDADAIDADPIEPDASTPDASTPDAADAGVCTDEICNGLDDDCDRLIDNGCPTGTVGFLSPVDTALTGWLPFGDVWAGQGCAPGDVVVGFYGHYAEYLNEVGEHCDTPTIVENTTSIPYTYSLALVAAPSALPRGGAMGTEFNALCPPGTMVVDISGRSGSWIDQLDFTCAEFELIDTVASGVRTFTVREVPGTRSLIALQAGGAGGGVFDLPCDVDFAAAVRLHGATGSVECCPSLITTLGLGCAMLGVSLR
jgi:hypothetical protein